MEENDCLNILGESMSSSCRWIYCMCGFECRFVSVKGCGRGELAALVSRISNHYFSRISNLLDGFCVGKNQSDCKFQATTKPAHLETLFPAHGFKLGIYSFNRHRHRC